MKNFLKKNWTLILVLLYIVSPDLIPGPLDDTALLIAEFLRRGVVSLLNKDKEEQVKNDKENK